MDGLLPSLSIPVMNSTTQSPREEAVPNPTGVTGKQANPNPSNSKDNASKRQTEHYTERESDDEANLFEGPNEFCDEHADSEDEKWLEENLPGASANNEDSASLSCPACFAQLSVQCQQHSRYQNQFRALFVSNCRVVAKETLRLRLDENDSAVEKKEPADCFQPVHCSKCETRVGVVDREGVYHFFNVVY